MAYTTTQYISQYYLTGPNQSKQLDRLAVDSVELRLDLRYNQEDPRAQNGQAGLSQRDDARILDRVIPDYYVEPHNPLGFTRIIFFPDHSSSLIKARRQLANQVVSGTISQSVFMCM